MIIMLDDDFFDQLRETLIEVFETLNPNAHRNVIGIIGTTDMQFANELLIGGYLFLNSEIQHDGKIMFYLGRTK